MSQSKSSPTNTTSTANQVNTVNKNVSGNTGTTLTNDGGNQNLTLTTTNVSNTTNVSTDQGAIKVAGSIASQGISAATTAFGISADVAQHAVDSNVVLSQDFLRAAQGLVESANSSNANSLDTINTLASGFATQLQGVISSEQEALAASAFENQKQLGNVVSALNQSFIQGSTSANQSVINAVSGAGAQETLVIKYVAFAVAAIAIVMLTKGKL